MTKEQIKEALSNSYASIIANRNGFRLVKGDLDKGIDFSIKYDFVRIMPNGERRESEAPHSCNIQLKATTEKSISINNNQIIYDLEAKNYNDLIFHKSLGFTPLILILFILPKNENNWVKILQDKLYLSKNAYWYFPDESEEVKNSYKKRIKIPIENKLDFNFFEETIKNWIPEWRSIN